MNVGRKEAGAEAHHLFGRLDEQIDEPLLIADMSQEAGTGMDGRVGYATKRLQQTLRAAADRALRPSGVTMPQYAVLSLLAEQPGLSSSELARRCFVTRQTMNELLAGLQATAMVIRTAHPRDRRVQRTELTVAGKLAAQRGDNVLADIEEQMTTGLTDTERGQLLDLLLTCTRNLDRADQSDPA